MFEDVSDFEMFIRLLRSGDDQAYSMLWRDGARRLIPYFIRIGCQPADAEDLWDNCVQRLYETRLKTYDASKAPLATWLEAVGRNAGLAYLRVRKQRQKLERPLDEGNDICMESAPDGPGTKRKKRQLELMAKAKASLTEDERCIISLALEEKLPVSVISERLGVSEGAARMRASRAFQRLWDVLERIGPGEVPPRPKKTRRRKPRRAGPSEFV